VNIIVNGQATEVAERQTVADVLRELGLPPVRVAVERNEDLVSRRDFEQTELSPGDRLEIVTFVGGG